MENLLFALSFSLATLLYNVVILFYIFYKNYFIKKLNLKLIIKKYKILLVTFLSLPFIFYVITQINLINYIDNIAIYGIYTLIIFSLFLFIACIKKNNMNFYDCLIFLYLFMFLYMFLLSNNKTESNWMLFSLISIVNFAMIAIHSLIEIIAVLYHQFIKK